MKNRRTNEIMGEKSMISNQIALKMQQNFTFFQTDQNRFCSML